MDTDLRTPAQTALDALLTGIQSQASPDQLESWKNATRGTVVIRRFSEAGRLVETLITGGRTVQLTPRERRLNAEAAASTRLNPFANGTFEPVRLIESEADTAEIAASPNVMSEPEMVGLFKAHWKQFGARIDQVDNVLLLHRLLEMAKAEETNATVRQLDVVKARIAVLEGDTAVDEVQSSAQPVGEARSARTI